VTSLERFWDRVLEARARRYASGRTTSERLDRPVVSVGNLTVGGTGKTPMVERLARWFLAEGKRPAILSRGYGRASRDVVVVSSGAGPLVGSDRGGDEPVELSRALPGAIVAVAPRRADAGRAVASLDPDVFILDDGYQHLALERDLDLLLFDAADPFGGLHYPPLGRLREPLSAIARADAIVFTRPQPGAPGSAALDAIARENPSAPRFTARIRAARLSDERGTAAPRPSRPFVGVCGIARPESFRMALAELDLAPAELLAFPDHRRYRAADMAKIASAVRRAGDDVVIVTTEKDAVKLSGRLPQPLLTVRLEVEIDEPDFFPFIRRRLFGSEAGEGRSGRTS
jgi:tetraacyldisaccharide 4'-kinase